MTSQLCRESMMTLLVSSINESVLREPYHFSTITSVTLSFQYNYTCYWTHNPSSKPRVSGRHRVWDFTKEIKVHSGRSECTILRKTQKRTENDIHVVGIRRKIFEEERRVGLIRQIGVQMIIRYFPHSFYILWHFMFYLS